jgi:hypothetical protein
MQLLRSCKLILTVHPYGTVLIVVGWTLTLIAIGELVRGTTR